MFHEATGGGGGGGGLPSRRAWEAAQLGEWHARMRLRLFLQMACVGYPLLILGQIGAIVTSSSNTVQTVTGVLDVVIAIFATRELVRAVHRLRDLPGPGEFIEIPYDGPWAP